jgi:hypothetical protein
VNLRQGLLRIKSDGGINNKEGTQVSDLVHGLGS